MKKLLYIAFLLLGFLGISNNNVLAQEIERNLVVVEIATGTWCGYCPGAAMGADDLVENGDPVAIIENHNGDSFANEFSNARNSYYSIGGFPTAKFDGVLTHEGGSASSSIYSSYLPKVNARMSVLTPFSFEIFGEKNNDGVYEITLVSEKLAEYESEDLVFVLAVTETHIPFAWKNQTEVNFVNRVMYPNAIGESVSFNSDTEERIYEFTLDPNWVEENVEVVGFLQNRVTKEVLNGQKSMILDLESIGPKVIASFESDVTTLCEKGKVKFEDTSIGDIVSFKWTFEGGDPSSSWDENPRVKYNSPGSYAVTLKVSDGEEESVLEMPKYIVFSEPINCTFDEVNDFCIDDAIYLLFEGSPAGGIYSGPGVSEGKYFEPAEAGLGTHTITYTYTNELGCIATATQTIFVDSCVGLDEDADRIQIKLYPNPVDDQLDVQVEMSHDLFDVSCSIMDLKGSQVFIKTVNLFAGQNTIGMELGDLEPGIYVLLITSDNFMVKEKLVVE